MEEVRPALAADPVRCAYMLGDLDEAHRTFCTWYAVGPAGQPEAIVLVYSALSVPVLITWGDAGGVDAILGAFSDQMPGRMMTHIQTEHLHVIDRYFESEELRPMLRMGLEAASFTPQPGARHTGASVERLGHRHTGDIMALFQHYPDVFFEPAQLDTGHYYGAIQDGRLASVAGVHVVSREDGVACLGNIVTHPDARGRGLSTACTSHLCQQLIADGVRVLALNVARRNASAMRVYEKLGFHDHHTYLEGILRASLAPLVREDAT